MDGESVDTPSEPQVVLKEYPDGNSRYRETYPPLPSKGLKRDVPMPEGTAQVYAQNATEAAQKRGS